MERLGLISEIIRNLIWSGSTLGPECLLLGLVARRTVQALDPVAAVTRHGWLLWLGRQVELATTGRRAHRAVDENLWCGPTQNQLE